MGLDMYLEVHEPSTKANERGRTRPIQVAYWRKANAIHQWFVMNVQDGRDDCESYDVTIKDLERLKDTCTLVLSKRGADYEHEYCKYFLPTQSGFFFGNQEYDEWYFQHLQETIEMISKFLYDYRDETNYQITYTASW